MTLPIEKTRIGSKRGPYRTAASGLLPKRRSEQSIENLARKSAERGKELEYKIQTLKRRDARISELEKILDAANHMSESKSEEANLLIQQLQETRAQIENLTADLQFLRKENEHLKIKAENNFTPNLAEVVKKKVHSAC